jgi:predicted nucleic acid-binding protein
MNADCVVVDANIAFKCLCTNRGDLRKRLAPNSDLKLYCPRFLFVELFKHKERIAQAGHLQEADLLQALHALVSRLEFVNEVNVPLGTWLEAYRLCKGVDEKDTPYVAITLHMDGSLWTEDTLLKTALRSQGFDRFYEP